MSLPSVNPAPPKRSSYACMRTICGVRQNPCTFTQITVYCEIAIYMISGSQNICHPTSHTMAAILHIYSYIYVKQLTTCIQLIANTIIILNLQSFINVFRKITNKVHHFSVLVYTHTQKSLITNMNHQIMCNYSYSRRSVGECIVIAF